MCGTMVNIQSTIAENRPGKKNKVTTAAKYNVRIYATHGGHKKTGRARDGKDVTRYYVQHATHT